MKKTLSILLILITIQCAAMRSEAIEIQVKTFDVSFESFLEASAFDYEFSSKNGRITVWIHPSELDSYNKNIWGFDLKIKSVENRKTKDEWTGLYVLEFSNYEKLLFKDVKNYNISEMFYYNEI